jgi:peptide/nickel transport system permease protein
MIAFLRRLALLPPTLVGITLATFVLVHLAPGDPATLRAGTARGVSAESIAALRAEYGLDRPLVPQYLTWAARSARLDFGRSFVDGRPVRERIVEALPVTLALALFATVLAYLVGVPLGCLLAVGDRRPLARAAELGLALAYALPTAAVGMWLLSAGAPYGAHAGALVAAAGCLAVSVLVTLARYQHGAVLFALRADYVRTARAKGAGPLGELRHALRNALLPTVTLLGAQLPVLLSGAIVVEQVFGVRGLGLTTFDAVLARDYPLLLGLTTLGAVVTLGGVLAADALYLVLDPRLRERG